MAPRRQAIGEQKQTGEEKYIEELGFPGFDVENFLSSRTEVLKPTGSMHG